MDSFVDVVDGYYVAKGMGVTFQFALGMAGAFLAIIIIAAILSSLGLLLMKEHTKVQQHSFLVRAA